MPFQDTDLESMFHAVPALLDTVRSVVEFLGPFTDEHPATAEILANAATEITEEEALAARKFERAEQRMRDLDLSESADFDAPAVFERRARRVKVLVEGRRSSGWPAIQKARRKLSGRWIEDQLSRLRQLLEQVEAFVASASHVLPGIGGQGLVEVSHIKHTSACSAACTVARRLLDDDELRNNVHALWEWSKEVDYPRLEALAQCELAALIRQHGKAPPSRPATTTDFAFLRVLIEAQGERLGFAQIFERARSNPKTSSLFPMPRHNRDHETRIDGLIGRNSDGWVIRGTTSGRGRRREFWAERETNS